MLEPEIEPLHDKERLSDEGIARVYHQLNRIKLALYVDLIIKEPECPKPNES